MARSKLNNLIKKSVESDEQEQSVGKTLEGGKKVKVSHTVSDDTYFAAVPSYKSEVRFFTTMGNRVVVETFKSGAIRASGPAQAKRLDYLKKRFGPYMFRASEVQQNPMDQKVKEEKIRLIKSQIQDRKLAAELISKL